MESQQFIELLAAIKSVSVNPAKKIIKIGEIDFTEINSVGAVFSYSKIFPNSKPQGYSVSKFYFKNEIPFTDTIPIILLCQKFTALSEQDIFSANEIVFSSGALYGHARQTDLTFIVQSSAGLTGTLTAGKFGIYAELEIIPTLP